MNNNTNEDGDFPRTGTPAHNKAKPRDVDSLSLADKYPSYEPDPACMECGGGYDMVSSCKTYPLWRN